MKKVNINLDEVLGEINKMHLKALKHAVEISPFVTERTLGADLPERIRKDAKDDTQETPTDEIIKSSPDKQSSIISSPKEQDKYFKDLLKSTTLSSPPSCSENINSMQNVDLKTIYSGLLLRDAEQKRRSTIRQQVIEKNEQIISKCRHSIDGLQQQNNYNDWLQKKRRSDTQILQDAEKLAAAEQQHNESQLNALRSQTKRQLQAIAFTGVAQNQRNFKGKYEIVSKLLMSMDKQNLISCASYNTEIKELIKQFEELILQMKSGDCGAKELQKSKNLCKSLDNLEATIVSDLEKLVQREQQKADALKAEAEAEAAAAVAAEQVLVQSKASGNMGLASAEATVHETAAHETATHEAVATSAHAHVSPERLAFYNRIITAYEQRVERVKPLQADPSLQKYRSACLKAITTPINAISAVSPENLKDKFDKLYNFFMGQPFKIGDSQITINDHPLAKDYCILLMAKRFASQGDSTVSCNPKAAFPMATMIVSLWKHWPEFGETYLAYSFNKSPFLVPYFIPQKPGQSIEQYFKVLGYHVENQEIEKHDQFLKRLSGIVRLYAAVMITSGRQADGPNHPYGLEHGWRWFANFVSLEPLPDICATLLLEMLNVMGAELWAVYGQQFTKLLHYMQNDYLKALSAEDKEEGGPKDRFKRKLAQMLKEGGVSRPDGVLSNNFW